MTVGNNDPSSGSLKNQSPARFSERIDPSEIPDWLDAVVGDSQDAIIGIRPNGIIVNWNRAAEQIYGHTPGEAVGRSVACIVPAELPEEHDSLLGHIRDGLGILRHETTHLSRDGTRIEVELTVSPVRQAPDRLIGTVLTCREISERKRAERELRDRAILLEAQSEATNQGILVVYGKGPNSIRSFNRKFQQLWGFTDDEMRNRSDSELLEKAAKRLADPASFLEKVHYYYINPEVSGWEEVHLANGRVLERYTAPVRDEMGEIQGRGWYFQDVTARKHAEEAAARERQLAESRARQLQRLTIELTETEQKERRRLARLLHDNLQQLLVAAKFRVDQLQKGLTDSGLLDESRRVGELINESLNVSRSLTTELCPPQLYELGLIPALELLTRWFAEYYDFTVHLDTSTSFRIEDESKRAILFESVRELLFNAVKHAGTKDAWVIFSNIGDSLQISVEDLGTGFEAESARFSFGLLSVKERIEWLGGSMDISSFPGRGTRVLLRLAVDQV